jgi:hypothetical protein
MSPDLSPREPLSTIRPPYKPFMNMSNPGENEEWTLLRLETVMFIGAVLGMATAATWVSVGV